MVVDKSSAVAGVKTSLGYIECESFINAAGFWARHIGTKSTPRVQVKTYQKRLGVNFINISHMPFMYKSAFLSFSLITVWLCNF